MSEEVLRRLEDSMDDARERLFSILRIPSVSAQPAHAADCAAAAEWFRDQLSALGFEASVRPTPGHPVVLAHHPGPGGGPGGGAPHVLFYGHYDVQPAEPLELWRSPPFEPVMAPGPNGPQVVARGAVDDKGQVMMFVEACRAWHASTGGLPVRVTVLLEGEEEVGSVNLDAFLEANRAELAADMALISDTGMWDAETPALTTRLRGMVYTQVTITGPDRDLHSGGYGGSAINPINVLTRILGALHDADGRVQVPGFYDAVRPVPPELAARWASLGFDEGAFLAAVGLSAPAGERGVPALERLWARPTADVNGIWGGYTGHGSKTVIASQASAKVSFRLVPAQDPQAVWTAYQSFVRDRLPEGAKAEFEAFGLAPGIEAPSESRWMRAASAALEDEFGRAPVLIGSGGSIPVVGSLKALLGLDTVLMGFGLDDDQTHSPNEKFDWACFRHGARSHVRLLGRLASG